MTSSFASIFQEDDFQIKRFVALIMTTGPTFKHHNFFLKMAGRKRIQKRSVTDRHQKHSSFSQSNYYIVTVLPKRCTKNKLIGSILETCIFKNSVNFKNLKLSLLTFIAFYLK